MASRGIQTLIRMHRWQLDELRRRTAPLEQERQRLIDHGRALVESLHDEHNAVQAGAAQITDLLSYRTGILKEQDAIAAQVAEIDRAIEQLRDQITTAYQDVKKFEITEEQRLQSEKLEREQREQSRLDEIGLNNHHRRKQH